MSLLSIENLRVRFPSPAGTVHAVNGVSLEVERGEILGIVGESGSGKSVSCLSLMGLQGSARANLRSRALRRRVGGRRADGRAASRGQVPRRDDLPGRGRRDSNPIRTSGSQIAEVFGTAASMTAERG